MGHQGDLKVRFCACMARIVCWRVKLEKMLETLDDEATVANANTTSRALPSP